MHCQCMHLYNVNKQHCLGAVHASTVVMLQLKNAPDFTKVKVHPPTYKGSGGIEPSEERSQKQDQAAQAYAKASIMTVWSCLYVPRQAL